MILQTVAVLVAGLVPINTRIAGWDLDHLPDDWKRMRLTWDSRHAVRLALLTVAFACLVTACLTSRG